ncbi:MAG: alpha-glucuronidase family glycosyl hydrolase [Lentisphaerota bacterium]
MKTTAIVENSKSTATNGFIYEKILIESGLRKLGIDDGYEIVIADNPDIVENTAAEELQKFLGKGGLNVKTVQESKSVGKKRFLLGRDANLKTIARLGDSGELKIRDVSTDDDGFHLKRIGDDFIVSGANPRGVLYGVYAFEDFIIADTEGSLDIKEVPYYRKRGSGLHYSFNPHVEFVAEVHLEEKVEYLARLGINQLTDQGICGNIQRLVRSEAFPFETPPEMEYQSQTKKLSALCRKFGIEHYVWLQMPNLAADAGLYPKQALGKVKRPWGGDQNGMDTTLCVNSSIVQEYLRNMMRQLVREYPDVAGVLLYNLDGDHWLCTPEYCDRCRIFCADSRPDTFTPWETQAKLVTLLADAAHEENPEFVLMLWGAVHYHGEYFDRMIHEARGYGRLLACWSGSDRSVMVPTAAEPDSAFFLSKDICAERGIPFHMIFEFNNLESLAKSLPFPFHVCDALRTFKRWGTRNLTEIYGVIPEHNSINALVMKAFQWNPDLDPEVVLADLSLRQLGAAAGKLTYQAWKEMSKAFDVWNDLQFSPLDGSQHILSIGTSVPLPPPILPDIVKRYNDMLQILTNVEPWRADGYRKFKEQAFLDKMRLMNRHLAQAAEHAQQAIAAASDKEFIGICLYEGPNGRPTQKEYAELNYASIAIAAALCRQRCNMLRAYHLLTKMKNTSDDNDKKAADAKNKIYRKLIREDIGVQTHFCELLTGFAGMQSCCTRTSLTEREISDLLSRTKAKIDKLKEFLAKPLEIKDKDNAHD